MELDERLKNEIADIFRRVDYGRITFFLSPERRILNYSVEESGKINISNKAPQAMPDGRKCMG